MSKNLLIRLLSEALGTFFLTCSVGLALFENNQLGPFLVASSLFAAMGATAFISGAQFNPAVTTGVIVLKAIMGHLNKATLKELLLYYLVQMVGAFLGALNAYAISGNTYHFAIGNGYNEGQAFFGELTWTTILVTAALFVGQTNDSKLVAGLCVISTILSGALCIGPISGGAFNPAVAFGVSLLDVMRTGADFKHWWIYLLAPLMAGGIGGCLVHVFSLELGHKQKGTLEEPLQEGN